MPVKVSFVEGYGSGPNEPVSFLTFWPAALRAELAASTHPLLPHWAACCCQSMERQGMRKWFTPRTVAFG